MALSTAPARFLTLVTLTVALATVASADNVFVDFNGSDVRLQTAWDSFNNSGAQDLTSDELASIKTGVVSRLQTAFNGFNINFSTSNPGGNFARLRFDLTAGVGNYGLADAIDWRNPVKNDTARVYTANFGDFLSNSFNRTQNLAFLTDSLARISAHELGHNYGLQHYDSFGYATNTVNGGYDSGSVQTNHIMNTFAGGQTEVNTRQMGTFNELEKMKLEFADGIAPTLGTTVNEAAGDNNSLANAQFVQGTLLPVTQRYAVNVKGFIDGGDQDFFRFSALQGDRITANIFSNTIVGDTVDTFIDLLDSNGNVLFSNDDISFSTTALMGSGLYSFDSLILNYTVAQSADYYVKVRGFGSTSIGDYQLLIAGAVPEPATLGLVALAGLAALRRRKA